MDSKLIKKIVLVGNDCNVFVAALLLNKNLRQYGVEVTCVELPESDEVCPVECIGAEFSSFCSLVGVNEFDVIAATRGIFTYGTHYHTEDRNWFCPYGKFGLVGSENEFEQGLFHYLCRHSEKQLDDYSLAAVAAKSSKFAVAGDRKPDLQLALEFGAVLDAKLYKIYLKRLVEKSGVNVVECSSIIDVVRGDNHEIRKIVIDGSVPISADFWFDCSGDSAFLASGLDAYKKFSPREGLKYDRIAYFSTVGADGLGEPFSTLSLSDSELVKKIPLRDQAWYQVHFESSRYDEREIITFFERNIGNQARYQYMEKLDLGFLSSPWLDNCLFIGRSGCNLGCDAIPESSLVQEAVVRFLDVYPSRASLEMSARGYNDSWKRVVSEAVEYTMLHVLLSSQGVGVDALELPSLLRKRINLFKRHGRLPVNETDIVRDHQWYAMFFGMGLRPELHSIMISSLTDHEIDETMGKLESIIGQIAKTMPSSREFLKKFVLE